MRSLLSALLLFVAACSGFRESASDASPDAALGDLSQRDALALDDFAASDTSGDMGTCANAGSSLFGDPIANAYSADTAIAIAPDGTTHVVYEPQLGSDEPLLYQRRGADGSWSSPEQLNPLGTRADKPLIALADDGTVHVVYQDIGVTKPVHRHKAPQQAWSGATIPSSIRGQGELVAGTQGVMHLLLAGGRQVLYYRFDGLAWSAPTTLETSAPTQTGRVALARDKGKVYALFCDDKGTLKLRSAADGPSPSFTAATPVMKDLDPRSCGASAVADGSSLHIAFANSKGGESTITYLKTDLLGGVHANASLTKAKRHAVEFAGYHLLRRSSQLWLVAVSPKDLLRIVRGDRASGHWAPPEDTPWRASFGVSAALGPAASLHVSHWDPPTQRPRLSTICP